jgi:hypothetical protein
METENTTATGYSNGTIKQKRTEAMDMHFYWIKDRGNGLSKFSRLFHETSFAGAS